MTDFDYKIQGKIIFENRLYENYEIIKIVNKTKNYVLRNFNDNKPVAIAMPRCVYLLTSVLALLESKIAYLLIDIDLQPQKRIEYILEDSNVSTVLTISNYEYYFSGKQVVNVDEIKDTSKCNIEFRNSNLAYLLYTSGTTGLPKGVEISRESLHNFIKGITNIIKFNSSDRIISFTSPSSFDIFFLEAIMPLYFGTTVVLGSRKEIKNPQKQIELIQDHQINMMQITPSGLRLLSKVDKNLTFLKNIHTIMVGGEVFPLEILQKLQLNLNMKIYNMYGPTETTIWSSVADLSNSDYIHLGSPILNTEIFLLDDSLCRVSDGVKGEICISGSGLANGYHNNEELTSSKFCKVAQLSNRVVYRTGDMGVINSSGKLLYVGRIDNQIKLHGHRIELEEIETAILSLETITDLVVCFDEKNEELVAFYSSTDGKTDENIIAKLKEALPKYMIPNKFILVEKFIYSSNGKIDRKAVLGRYLEDVSRINRANENSKKSIIDVINLIVSKCLHITDASIDWNLTIEQLGFDSITYVEFIVELEKLLNINFEENVLSIDNFKNLKQLYEYISSLIDSRGVQ